MNNYDPRVIVFRAIGMARVDAGVPDEFTELERAVINDLLDRVRVPRPAPMEVRGGTFGAPVAGVRGTEADVSEAEQLAAGHG